MENLQTPPVNGFCAPDAEPVAQAFAENFQHFGEQGAALTVFKGGEPLVDLWAGTRDKAQCLPWEHNTRVNIFSAGKAFVALCVLKLVERGELELDRPVAHYWPEFAAAGKSAISVRQVLCHRSGVSAFREPVDDGVIFDWPRVVAAIAAERPWWEPGTAQGYSPMLFGWLLGELVRRVTASASFDDYFQATVAGPLGLEAAFGIEPQHLAGLADVGALKIKSTGSDSAALGDLMKSDPRGIANRAFTNPLSMMMGTNSPAWRQAQIPAANGQASARALARFYNALVAPVPEKPLLAERNLAWCWEPQSHEHDRVLNTPLRFSLGFMLTQAREDSRFGRGARGFGHPGAGGCLGFADPEHQIGFGYVTNRMGQSVLMDRRAIRLVDAVYSCLETR